MTVSQLYQEMMEDLVIENLKSKSLGSVEKGISRDELQERLGFEVSEEHANYVRRMAGLELANLHLLPVVKEPKKWRAANHNPLVPCPYSFSTEDYVQIGLEANFSSRDINEFKQLMRFFDKQGFHGEYLAYAITGSRENGISFYVGRDETEWRKNPRHPLVSLRPIEDLGVKRSLVDLRIFFQKNS